MKKFLSIVLALALTLTAVAALADVVPSPTLGDLSNKIDAANTTAGLIISPADEDMVKGQLDGLKNSEDIGAYFDSKTTSSDVEEFFGIEVDSSEVDAEAEKVQVSFATFVADGTSVQVLIGLVKAVDDVEWQEPIESVVEDGKITIEIAKTTVDEWSEFPWLVAVVK